MMWMRINHALITDLAECWHPKTNTFHLPIGEVTVTLKDVAYIYGLPINGPTVTSRAFPNSNVADVCEELLGKRLVQGVDFNGISIKFTRLDQHFRPTRDEKNKKKKKKKLSFEEEITVTRVYLFFLVFGQILANASRSRGPTYLLELFRKFNAWAPVCLGNLYRMLTKGEQSAGIKNTEGGEATIRAYLDLTDESDAFEHMFMTMSGPLQLLQFEWQPYKKLGKAFLRSVPKADRELFMSSLHP
ncbi:hypothetical protein AAC387_Pa10g0855 [Persea americana]